MNILHVNHMLDPRIGGGTAERTLQLAQAVHGSGAGAGILALDLGDWRTAALTAEGVTLHMVRCINQRYFVPLTTPVAIERIISQYDIVHMMGHWTLLNALVYLVCRRLDKPYVVCPAGALKRFGRSFSKKACYDLLIGRSIIRNASAWIVIADNERSDYEAYGIFGDAIRLIPNGVDESAYDVGSHCAQVALRQFELEERSYLLFLGRLNEIKGPDILLEAFVRIAGRYPNMHLVLAGPDDGMLHGLRVRALAAGLGSRVHFPGFIAGDAKSVLLRYACCLVVPSRREAMSIVVLEAGILATPVVFTDQCGLGKFAICDAGVMVKPTEDSIAEGLAKVLENPEKAKESGLRLKKIVESEFTWDVQAAAYKRLYRRLV